MKTVTDLLPKEQFGTEIKVGEQLSSISDKWTFEGICIILVSEDGTKIDFALKSKKLETIENTEVLE